MTKYEQAFEKLVEDEGMYSNVKFDAGGETIFGISKNSFPEEFDKIYSIYKNGEKGVAMEVAFQFYKKKFWNILFDELQYSLAEKIFSLSVNMGKKKAIKILQNTINEYFHTNLKVDGVFGSDTLKTIKNLYQKGIRACYIFELMKYHKALTDLNENNRKFLVGWFKRDVS